MNMSEQTQVKIVHNQLGRTYWVKRYPGTRIWLYVTASDVSRMLESKEAVRVGV
jgi:hypothetical protein